MLTNGHHPRKGAAPLASATVLPSTFLRSATEFSRDRTASVASTSTKVQLVVNRTERMVATDGGYANQHSSKGVSLIQASNKVTMLPVTTIGAPCGKVRNIPIKQLAAAMPVPPPPPACTSATASPSSGGSCATVAAAHPRPLRVAQPPPLMATAFPSCSASVSSRLANSVSVPALPKPNGPFHRSVASASSGVGGSNYGRIGMVVEQSGEQNSSLGGRAGPAERGRSRFGQMSYQELLELARNQQRQIESNETELDERRRAVALFDVAKRTAANETEQQQNARILMASLRTQIARDELELAHLGNRQREAKQLRDHNERQSKELKQLEAEYGHDDAQLRGAVAKVDSLRRQLELLYQRRATAADAVLASQRRINGESCGPRDRTEKRPKASVVPFKQEHETEEADGKGKGKGAEKAKIGGGGGGGGGDGTGQNGNGTQGEKPPPPSYQAPINWRRSTALEVDQFSIKRNSMTALKRLSWVGGEGGGGDEYILNLLVNEQKKGRTHICFGETVPTRSTVTVQQMPDEPNPWKIPEVKIDQQNAKINGFEQRKGMMPRGGQNDQLDQVPLMGEDRRTKEQSGGDPERKRTTDAEKKPENTGKGCSPVKRMLAGQESLEFHKKFAEKLAERETEEEVTKDEEEEDEKERKDNVEREAEEGERECSSDKSEEEEEEEAEDQQRMIKEEEEEMRSKGMVIYEVRADEQHPPAEEDEMMLMMMTSPSPESGSAETSDDEPLIMPLFDESCFAGPSNSKSILRQAGAARKDKKVRFDLVVLFLDVAYEGQFDALVELASKIDNISVANSEGITALHYAICAGFIESVKFLIEKGADVNAVDIDGWTPLHCAASCTNLVMVRQLIENGACPFATTSKSETAAQLFEESSDYANRAEYMETLEDCMGVINDGKVYTAYAYEAEQDDELTFAEGDELRVLRKSECEHEANGEKSEEDYESEQFWWLCEHCATGQRGLVPRNFLALTPTWKFRSRYPSAIHELPQPGQCRRPETDSAVNNGNKPKGSSPTDQLELLSSKGSSNNNGSSTTSTGAGGHQELSTYA